MEKRILDDRYEILDEVGSGGMAVVYRGKDHRLGGREIAVKLMHPHLAARKESRQRFKNEADAAAKLEHDNILKVFDASGLDTNESYIVMEFVRGETLAALIEKRGFAIPEMGVMVTYEVAGALAHAHASRILHRDVKPENIMVREDGVIKLMDFGIARAMDTSRMTMTGALMGSPAHMAPEHIEGKKLDFRADVFSLGTVLYFLTTGVLPFTAPSPHALLRKILEGDFTDPQRVRPAVGRRLSKIIKRALARDPRARYQSMEEMQADLGVYLNDMGVSDPSTELKLWIQRPTKYEATLRKQVVEKLLAHAEKAISKKRRAAALESVNRIICLDEGNKKARALLERLNISARRQSRMKIALLVAGATAAAFGLIALIPILNDWLPDTVEDKVSEVTQTQAPGWAVGPNQNTSDQATDTAADESRSNPTTKSLSRRQEETEQFRKRKSWESIIASYDPRANKNTHTEKIPKEKTFPFKMKLFPSSAVLTINGTPYPELQRGPKTIQLKEGTYRYLAMVPSCDQCEKLSGSFVMSARKPLKAKTFKVPVKPANLMVKTNVPAKVSVDGRARGKSGSQIQIPLDITDLRMGRSVKLEISAKGYQSISRNLRLRPGNSETLNVSLAPKPLEKPLENLPPN